MLHPYQDENSEQIQRCRDPESILSLSNRFILVVVVSVTLFDDKVRIKVCLFWHRVTWHSLKKEMKRGH